jgi:abortive infection bacteriophage resistance protein
MPTSLYQKPYLAVSEQVELLRSRGMHIGDKTKAEACLHRIGYYRLSGYAYPFRHRELIRNEDGSETERIFENFRPNTDFSTVMELYVFDKRLRLLFLDAIERIEVALRVEIALHLGKRGALSYRDQAEFNSYFTTAAQPLGETPHQRWLSKLDDAFSRSREEFALHYVQKYSSPPPLWMSIEVWDFGCLAAVLNGMKDSDLNQIASIYKLPRRRYITSWSQSINFVRNICAHHGRLWNRPLVQQPAPPAKGDLPLLEHLAADPFSQRRLYAAAAILQHLISIVHPASTWGSRLIQHVATLPESPYLSTRHMGFPQSWGSLELWKTT